MSSVSLFFFEILLVSVVAGEATSQLLPISSGNNFTTLEPISTNETIITNVTNHPSTTFTLPNSSTPTYTNNQSSSVTTGLNDKDSNDNVRGNTPTPKPKQTIMTTKTTTPTTTKKTSTTAKKIHHTSNSGDQTGIIILIVLILLVLGFGITCCIIQRRRSRLSVNFTTSRVDEVNIPLSTAEPEVSSAPLNGHFSGFQSLEETQTTEKEPEEPEGNPESQEEQKAEADKPADSSAEAEAPATAPAPAAAPAAAPDNPEDKSKADVVDQSASATVEPSSEEKTDDEDGVSNKTSVESLKETNENNSNNVDSGQIRERHQLTEVRVDAPE